MNLRDDKETEEIGKLTAAGYPELAAKTFRSRFRHRTLTYVALAIIAAFTGANAILSWLH